MKGLLDQTKELFLSPNGSLEPLESGYSSMGPPRNDYFASRGANPNSTPAPAWGASGRTPNPYADNQSRTPGWTTSRTPNPYADHSSRTPAWNSSSKTPNPYAQDGGRTPAWNASTRTPNPQSVGNWGGATPKPSGWSDQWGGSTPKVPGNTAWGGATPGRTNWGGATPQVSAWATEEWVRRFDETAVHSLNAIHTGSYTRLHKCSDSRNGSNTRRDIIWVNLECKDACRHLPR